MRWRINLSVILKLASLDDSPESLCFWRLLVGIGLAGGLPVGRLQLLQQTGRLARHQDAGMMCTRTATPSMNGSIAGIGVPRRATLEHHNCCESLCH